MDAEELDPYDNHACGCECYECAWYAVVQLKDRCLALRADLARVTAERDEARAEMQAEIGRLTTLWMTDVLAEREACAQVCADVARGVSQALAQNCCTAAERMSAEECAERIRARAKR